MYHLMDPIADSDLGFAKARKFGSTAARLEIKPPMALSASNLLPTKRLPPSPDRKRKNEDKRPRLGETNRERYLPPSPSWVRDRHIIKLRHPARDEKTPTLPPVIHRFVAQLPAAETFNGSFPNLSFSTFIG